MKTIISLTTKLKSADFDYTAAAEELDEHKERSQRFLGQLEIQQGTVATPNSQLKSPDIATKMREFVTSYNQLMVPNDAPKESITRRFLKLSLLCHPGQGRSQEAYVRLQHAQQNLRSRRPQCLWNQGMRSFRSRSQFQN